MKALIALTMLAVSSAFGAQKTETINTNGSVSVHELRCEIRLGSGPVEDRTATVLRPHHTAKALTIFHSGATIELEHNLAQKKGCDLTVLDKLSIESVQSFGFVHNTPIEIVREISAPYLTGSGKCREDVKETLNLDIGVDVGASVVITSTRYGVRDSTECK